MNGICNNWSAVYFNALALYKPVLATAVLNPEILKNYTVGQEVDLQDLGRLRQQLGAVFTVLRSDAANLWKGIKTSKSWFQYSHVLRERFKNKLM